MRAPLSKLASQVLANPRAAKALKEWVDHEKGAETPCFSGGRKATRRMPNCVLVEDRLLFTRLHLFL